MHIDIPSRRRAVIGLTPLIDVVFILLVFFMLASSFLDWRAIDLATGTGDADPDSPPPAVVRVDAAGGLHYEGRALAPETLAERLRARLAAGDVSSVVVRPGAGVDLATAIDALDTLTGAGVEALALGRGGDG